MTIESKFSALIVHHCCKPGVNLLKYSTGTFSESHKLYLNIH